MYDVIKLKDMVVNGGVALSKSLEERVLNDELTENDYEFLSKCFGTLRDIRKKGFENFDPTESA